MNANLNVDQHKETHFNDQLSPELLARRDRPDFRELAEKSIDFENLKPQQIIDVKRCETNYISTEDLGK